MDAQVRKVSSRKMHDIVWILVGVFGLFAITFPLAMWRVSNMEKFQGSHVKIGVRFLLLRLKISHENLETFPYC